MDWGIKTAIGRLALDDAPGVNGDDTIAMKEHKRIFNNPIYYKDSDMRLFLYPFIMAFSNVQV